MEEIKIYISCHKECFIPTNSLLFPIQVGSALADKKLPAMLHDDTGENISAKNRMYCELTAQYWAWKNDTADWYGFFHYRRYLSFSHTDFPEDEFGNVIIQERSLREAAAEFGLLDAARMVQDITTYDCIVPRWRTLPVSGMTVYEQYCSALWHHQKDLDTAVTVLHELFPEYDAAAQQYLSSNRAYDCNMFIMKRSLFVEYTSWLFAILFEVERRSDFSSYNIEENRVMGYLGERLFGIWFTYKTQEVPLKTRELQRVLFYHTAPFPQIVHTQEGAVVTVFACNDRYVPCLAPLICSIVQNAQSARPYELYVLTTDISKENEARLKALVKTDSRFSLACLDVSGMVETHDFFVHMHISRETYFRFCIPELFARTQKVLYLDSDMVVQADVSELYDVSLEGACLGAVRDVDCAGSIRQNAQFAHYIHNTVGCSGPADYFQAGVILCDIPKMRQEFSFEELAAISAERAWTYMDQCVLNHAFLGKVYYLEQRWNVLTNCKGGTVSRAQIIHCAPRWLSEEWETARKNPAIIHYAGAQKPWNSSDCDMAEYFWSYARNTSFYEVLMERHTEEKYAALSLDWNKKLCSRKFLVYCLFGKTRLYRVAQKIYHALKKKKQLLRRTA